MITLIHTLRAAILLVLLTFIARPAHAAPGDLDSLDASIGGSNVFATVVQPDGKTIITGNFSSVLGVPRSCIARLNADGTLDMGFDPKANGSVASVAVQADGKVLLGGGFTTLQPNGAGAAIVWPNIARLNADGTLDMGFDPKANGSVSTVVVQADGKVLLGGYFTTLQPNGAATATTREYIARVNADGTLDTGFDPKANNEVLSVAVQADGKVLLGGNFTTLQPNGAATATARQYIARLNANGTLDTSFDPKANSTVYSVAIQADGKVLLGGLFTTLQPNGAGAATVRQRIARMNAEGTLDPGFDPNANNFVYSMAIQADGKVLLGGGFTTLQPNGAATATTRPSFARLVNDPATQTLTVPDGTQTLWTRGGAGPELSRVTFELSTDGGTTWGTSIAGTRIGATPNWQRTGLTLPASGHLRARGVTTAGFYNGSSGLIEQVVAFNFDTTTLAPTLIAPVTNAVTGNPVSVSFTLPEAALAGSVMLSFGSTELTLAASQETSGAHSFTFNPASPTASPEVASGPLILPDGTYTVTLSYQDALGNPAASAVATNVEVDAVPNAPVTTLLASKNGVVPNAGAPGSGVQAGAIWTAFGVPSVNGAGAVAYLASWKAPMQSGTGIFVGDALVVKKGDAVPGIANAVFGSFKDPLLGPDGSVAWMATLANAPLTMGAVLSTSNTAIFLDADGAGPNAPVLIAREGDVAPGTTAAVWSAFTSVALGADGMAFTGSLLNKTAGVSPGPGNVTTLNDTGLWVYDRAAPALTLALREGGALLGSTVKTFNALVARPGSGGQGRGAESDGDEDYTVFRAMLADGRSTVGYVDMLGAVTPLYTSGDGAVGYDSGALWLGFGLPTQNAAASAMAFLGTVKSGTGTATSANNVAIFAEEDATYAPARLVSKGDAAAGVSGGIFSALKDPVSAGNRSVAFLGTMKANGTTITSADDAGIWHRSDSSALALVARENAQPPEAPAGAKWKAFTSLALPEGRGPLFVASMHSKIGTTSPGPGGITTANDIGLWATDSNGALRLLLQEGDAIGTSTVKSFTVLSTVAGSPAQTRGFNAGGSVVLKVTDMTGAQHLVQIAVP